MEVEEREKEEEESERETEGFVVVGSMGDRSNGSGFA